MNIKILLGQNIAKYRKIKKMTQEELSEKLDVSVKHLSNIEIGNNFVSATLLEKISDILDVSPSALFYSSEIIKTDYDVLSRIDGLIREQAEMTIKKIREEL